MSDYHVELSYENIQAAISKSLADGDRIIFQQDGNAVVALISIEELEILQKLEEKQDEYDLKVAIEAMAEPGMISWDELKVELGI
jgi:hypothetical protein